MKLLTDNKNSKDKTLNLRCTNKEKDFIMDYCKLIATENDLKNSNYSTVVRFLFDSYKPKYFDKNDLNERG